MRDCWTARSFDNAVMAFGVFGDNFLNELDEEGKRVHTIMELLQDPGDIAVSLHNNTVQGQMLAMMLGGKGHVVQNNLHAG